jgi:hypothetical protein
MHNEGLLVVKACGLSSYHSALKVKETHQTGNCAETDGKTY